MSDAGGGYHCPVPGCEFSDVLRQFLLDHIAHEHPDHKKESC